MMSGREHSRLSCLVGKMQVMATDIIAMDGDVCRMNGIKLQFEYNVCILGPRGADPLAAAGLKKSVGRK